MTGPMTSEAYCSTGRERIEIADTYAGETRAGTCFRNLRKALCCFSFLFRAKHISTGRREIELALQEDVNGVYSGIQFSPPPSSIKKTTCSPVRRLFYSLIVKSLRQESTYSQEFFGFDLVENLWKSPDIDLNELNMVNDRAPNSVSEEKEYVARYQGDLCLPLKTPQSGKKQVLRGFAVTIEKASQTRQANLIDSQKAINNTGNEEARDKKIPNFNNGRPVVVFFGGWGAPVDNLAGAFARYYASERKANSIAVNYRGFGNSTEGIPSQRSMIEDGCAIVEHLLSQGVPPEKIILHGYSMGSNIAANVLQAAEAKGFRFRLVVLDRPMESVPRGAEMLIKAKHPCILPKIAFGLSWLFFEPMNTQKALQKRKGTTPIVGVSDQDPIGKSANKHLLKKKDGIVSQEMVADPTKPQFGYVQDNRQPGHDAHREATQAVDKMLRKVERAEEFSYRCIKRLRKLVHQFSEKLDIASEELSHKLVEKLDNQRKQYGLPDFDISLGGEVISHTDVQFLNRLYEFAIPSSADKTAAQKVFFTLRELAILVRPMRQKGGSQITLVERVANEIKSSR